MKKLIHTFTAVTAAIILLWGSAPAAAYHHQAPEKDIVDTAISAGAFNILVAAVQAAGLEDTLRSDGPFTVFAPTDKAFEDLLEALGISGEDLLSSPQLATVLLYHVLPGSVRASDLRFYRYPETVSGNRYKVEIKWNWQSRSRDIMIDDAMIVTKNIYATNGIIHVIDKVLTPPQNLVETAKQAGQFSTLLAAVDAAGLTDTLNGPGPFTLFAPTDEAFEDLLYQLNISAAELLADPNLPEILLYHVVSGDLTAVDALRTRRIETIAGDKVKVRLRWSREYRRVIPMVNDARIVDTDIFTSNGTIHVIDRVLLP